MSNNHNISQSPAAKKPPWGYARSRPASGAVTGLAQPPSSSSHHKVPRLQLSLTAYRKAALAKHGSGNADFKARRKLFQGGLQCPLYGNSLPEPVFISEVLPPYFLCL